MRALPCPGAFLLLLAAPALTHANPPRLTRITAEPAEIVLSGAGARQQLLVTGHHDDGSVRDLTHKANYHPDRPGSVRVEGAVVHAATDGTATVAVRFEGHETSVKVTVRRSGDARPVSFRNDVMAVFSKSGCNAGTCHGNFNGKGGFKLSLRGENPDADLDNLTRDTHGRRATLLDPDASLALLKPTGQVPHEGGMRFGRDSEEYDLLRRWIAAGTKPDAPGVASLTRLEVTPGDRVLLHGATEQQLVARAHFSDGAVRDVTHLACYEPSSEALHVSPTGLVTAPDKGADTVVVVRYLDRRVPVRLAFVPAGRAPVAQAVPANNSIDRHVIGRLEALRIEPSALADDATFLRRAYLDVCGILPSAAEARAFLADRDPQKREKLIDKLLERPEYADFWGMKWADVLRNEEKAVDAKGVRLFHHWLRQQVGDDVPLDRLARTLLTARGSTYERPEANYYRTNLDPQRAAETTAQLFLGVRIQCAKCHNHPFDRWTQEDYHGLSAFFARVRTRMVDNKRRDRLDKHELVGEMVVWLDREGDINHPQKKGIMPPRLPGGELPKLAPSADRLEALAAWVTSRDNPFFARVMANRIWYHLLGRGIVEPVDDFRESNPPALGALLDDLAADLVQHGFSQKRLIRTIMRSRTYQLSFRPTATNRDDETNFARVEPRRLQAEVLLDAICRVTEVPEEFKGHPVGTRAVQLPGGSSATTFLKDFGRPERLLACECERSPDTTLRQAFQMISSETMQRKVRQSPVVTRLLQRRASDDEIVTEFYLAALSRPPSEREVEVARGYLRRAADRRTGIEDLLWAVVNTKEFQLRR